MTLARTFATATVRCEDWRRHRHGFAPIANPGEWTMVLENRFTHALHGQESALGIVREVMHVAH